MLSTLRHRLAGDRTGACVAAAVIDTHVRRAIACAHGTRALTFSTPMEIGSISKTMTAFLLAELVDEKLVALNDPLSSHLPEANGLSFEGEPVRLVHLLTHTSGLPALPSRIHIVDPSDPYAALTERELLDSLADVTLTARPGSHWAYSNFGFMLLSHLIAQKTDQPLSSSLREQLFSPLGMRAFVETPADVRLAAGHLPGSIPTPPWNFPASVAGVGGVRASLDDLIFYAQAALGQGAEGVVKTLARTREPLWAGEPAMAMSWFIVQAGPDRVFMHEGGTGGFSSLLGFDPAKQRAVVLLSDTALTNLGGLGDLALHLFNPEAFPLSPPRVATMPEPALLSALAGRYRLDELGLTLTVRDGTLYAMAEGQPELELAYDSYGDFYPLVLDAALTPVALQDGGYTFDWKQGGGIVRAERVR